MSDLLPQKNLKVEISSHALNDLEEIWLYVSVHGEQSADRILRQLTKKFSVLLNSPKIGRERNDLLIGLRSFPIGKHIIFTKKQYLELKS